MAAKPERDRQCEVIVNEILCFIANNINSIPTDDIILLCEHFYEDINVEAAKLELFSLTLFKNKEDTLKHATRKGAKKKQKSIEDIINKMHELDS